MHMSLPETQRKTKCIDVVKDRSTLIKENGCEKKSMVFMDSYYLRKDGARWLEKVRLCTLELFKNSGLAHFVPCLNHI